MQTEADLGLVREGFNALDFIVVQDIFMTKTAEMADVLLPATSWGEHGGVFTCADRGFQRFEKAIEPSGDVKRDWEIISLLASEMGYPMRYQSNQQIWDEMRELCPLFYGVTYEKMGEMGHIQWPCPSSITPAHLTFTRTASLIPPMAKANCLPHNGERPQKFLMKSIRWSCVQCVKLGTTPVVQ